MLNELQNKINARVRLYLNKYAKKADITLLYNYSRNDAHIARKRIVSEKGYKIVDAKTKKKIKEYCRETFGKPDYWPYIALYTEIRGEFIPGWMPEDFYWLRQLPQWNPYPQNQLCNLKTFDHKLFSDFSLTPLFLRISGYFFNSEFQVVSLIELMNFFKNYDNDIVVKEEFGRGGKEVTIMKAVDFDPDKLRSGKNYVIQPFVEQFELLNRLNPNSVNTFRVNTFLEENGIISVKFVFLRFGTNESKVDNLASGGNLLFFDLDGKPSRFAYDKLGSEIGEKHEHTGFDFSKLIIPGYKVMLEKCREAHRKFPYVRLIGWDVCFDKDGNPILLEWNADRPHIDALEGKFGPFFSEVNLTKHA
jgi:hypothetical protein